jgi:hypothetical protein
MMPGGGASGALLILGPVGLSRPATDPGFALAPPLAWPLRRPWRAFVLRIILQGQIGLFRVFLQLTVSLCVFASRQNLKCKRMSVFLYCECEILIFANVKKKS